MKDKLDKGLIDDILSKEHPIELSLDNNFKLLNNDIKVNKDEDLNDFFVAWKKFNNRPSKISIFSQFDSSGVWGILEKEFHIVDSDINKLAEIFTDPAGVIYNMKYFINISDDIFLSFFEFDKENSGIEEIYSSNLTIYYNQKNIGGEEINSILSLFQVYMIDISSNFDSQKKTVNTLYLNINNEFELKPILLNKAIGVKEIKSYYNPDIINNGKESIDLINNNRNGLTILDGLRGNGKTSFLLYMIEKINKKIIYVPATIFENTFTNIDFIDFLKSNPDSVLIFDDCENYFDKINQKLNLYSLNLLQILDGLNSNSLSINFILSMNIEKGRIDNNLFISNNFLSNITFSKLNKKKATNLSKKLGKNIKYDNNAKLVDVIKGKSINNDSAYY